MRETVKCYMADDEADKNYISRAIYCYNGKIEKHQEIVDDCRFLADYITAVVNDIPR